MRIGTVSSRAELIRDGTALMVVVDGATITIANRFDSAATGTGVEIIAFSDGIEIAVLDDPNATIVVTGDGTNNTLNGWAYRDVTYGGAGNDTLSGALGNDTLNGGTGDDTLAGGSATWAGVTANGADTYKWGVDDGSDRILDDAKSRTEIDRLEFLVDVAPENVTLRRLVGSNDLRIRIGDDLLTVVGRFENLTFGYGIEEIVFADGTVWQLEDIIARTEMYGDATASDSIAGGAFRDNIFGLGGTDTLMGAGGNDVLTGGDGADILRGGLATAESSNGNDTYVWSVGDGSDIVDDRSTGTGETDQLILLDVDSTQVTLTRLQGSSDLLINVFNGAVITDQGRFADATTGTGIESILFSDGVIWTLEDILAKTTSTGSGTETAPFLGTSFRDNLTGSATAADVIVGMGGDDWMSGGAGSFADSLSGGDTWSFQSKASNGNDTYVWTEGEGNDAIGDYSESVTETDRLILDVDQAGVDLYRTSGDTYSNLFIRVSGVGGATLKSRYQFHSYDRYGIEVIEFADGTEWSLSDILARTKTEDVAGATSSLVGTVYRDNIYGLGGADTLDGGAGADWLYGGIGADSIIGGADFDTVSYIDSAGGVIVNLALTIAQAGGTGESIGDRLSSVEALQGSNHADTLYGDNESNDLSGVGGNDALVGYDGYDRIYGGDGDDRLIGGIGGDRLVGGAGFDWADYASATSAVSVSFATSDINRGDADGDVYEGVEGLIGSAFNDTLRADDLANSLTGNAGDDNMAAQSGDDTLYGGAGADSLFGGDGDDLLDGGAGADAFNGVTGTDRVTYASATAAVRVGLTTATVGTGDAAGDTFTAIMGLIGSAFSDTLVGDAGQNSLTGSAGLDSLSGGVGLDSLYGGADNDKLFGEDGNDVLSGGEENDSGSGGNGNDLLYGGLGNDTLLGDVGDDVLDGGAGADQFFGGTGDDRVTYATATIAVRVDLTTLGNNTADAQGDTYTGIQSLAGSGYDDHLRSNDIANLVSGQDGDDTIATQNGDDTLYGGNGHDELYGGDDADVLVAGDGDDDAQGGTGNDVLDGGAGQDSLTGALGQDALFGGDGYDRLFGEDGDDTISGGDGSDFASGDVGGDFVSGGSGIDTLYGGDGDDTLDGGAGPDVFFGGIGTDRVSYGSATVGVLANLDASLNNAGDAAGDTYNGIQNLMGSDFNDSLRGNAAHNNLSGGMGGDDLAGGAGQDSLYGGDGNDTLYGQSGDDTLSGGNGVDTFQFAIGSDQERISDFEDNIDRIELFGINGIANHEHAMNAATQVNGDVKFDFGGGNILWVIGITMAALDDRVFVTGLE